MPTTDLLPEIGPWAGILALTLVAAVAVTWVFAALIETVALVAGIAVLVFVILYYGGVRVDRWLRYGRTKTKTGESGGGRDDWR